VTDYMVGHLDAVAGGLVDIHLARCDGCAGVLERMRAITQVLRELDPPGPAPVTPRLMTHFRGWVRKRGAAGEATPSRGSA